MTYFQEVNKDTHNNATLDQIINYRGRREAQARRSRNPRAAQKAEIGGDGKNYKTPRERKRKLMDPKDF